MPTREERRKIAERFRDDEYALEHFTLAEILDLDVEAEPFYDGYHRDPERLDEAMRNRLADLIEPEERMCRIVNDEHECPSWEYRFPPVLDVPGSIDEQLGKVDGEVTEAIRASFLETKWRVAEELMDVIHAAETALRMIEGDPDVDMDGVMLDVIEKNSKRGYYGGDADEQG